MGNASLDLTHRLDTGSAQIIENLHGAALKAHVVHETRVMGINAMALFIVAAKSSAPKRSGKMAGTFSYQSEVNADGIRLRHRSGGASGGGVKYAKFVTEGTGIYHKPDAHSSWGVNGYQRFTVGARVIHTMHTHHRGVKQNPFEDVAAAQMRKSLPLVAQQGGRNLADWIRQGVT